MSTNRSHRNIKLTITTLAGIKPEEMDLAVAEGINSSSNLSTQCFADIRIILPAASIMKRIKLEHISKYIARGKSVTRITTMEEVVDFVNIPA